MSKVVFDRVDDNIRLLATQLLDEAELQEVESVSAQILGSRVERTHAIKFMQEKMGTTPKRPMYYLNWELGHLPRWTRNVVRDAGDYIDHLIKHMTVEHAGFFKSFGLYRSLGTNVKKLRNVFGEELYENLNQYNECLYVPAKHDFKVEGHPHRFSGPEAIYACYITAKLGSRICELSSEAKRYASGESHYYSGRE